MTVTEDPAISELIAIPSETKANGYVLVVVRVSSTDPIYWHVVKLESFENPI